MRVTYNKLVRDRVPEIIEQGGSRAVTRVLDDDDEFVAALLAKLTEEAREANAAAPGDLLSELADILEVLQALAAAAGMTWEELLTVTARVLPSAVPPACRAVIARPRQAAAVWVATAQNS